MMKSKDWVFGFTFGCLGATAAGWVTSELRAQEHTAGEVHVCIGEDRALRLTGAMEPCAGGQRRFTLKEAGVEPLEPHEPGRERAHDAEPKGAAVLKERLADFDRRLDVMEVQSERGELGNKVVAPFEVIDRDGKVIFRVEEEAVRLYNGAGKAVAQMRANEDGGYFLGVSADAELVAAIGVSGQMAGVMLTEGGVTRLDLGRHKTAGSYRLRVFGPAGQSIAGIGERPDIGVGTTYVADGTGQIRAAMIVQEEGKGQIYINNRSGTMVLAATEGLTGGGLLEIMNASGDRMVAAGVVEGGVGVVRTGPGSFSPGHGLLGLPGSYIAGKPD
jgi:hypothetical protein